MKEKREAMGLSLQDASRLSGISHTHIRDIEDEGALHPLKWL
ncbi:MAG: helix-turn-helix domain-containing protein [Deltaproteobacteria bacterium]|nr:MAG: helix-turn-helix domain-containing protein [Deltaproteobacteria bacterium]